MTDLKGPDASDALDATDPPVRDPDRHSTWNTIDGTADIDEVLNEADLENFLVEPIPDLLDSRAASDTRPNRGASG
jgi:hypothetical protein